MKDYTSYALRDAHPSDAASIAGIWHRGWLDVHLGHVPDALVAHRSAAHFDALAAKRVPVTTVAVFEERVIGFVTAHDDEVEQIYVDADARGSDVANALLRHAEAKIASRFDGAWLAVVATNARARRFYERNGWSDGGAFDYAAEASGETILVPCRRYEKELAR